MNDHIPAARAQLPDDLRRNHVLDLIFMSLREDLTPEDYLPADILPLDVTSHATLPGSSRFTGRVFSKQAGVVAGLPVAAAVFKMVDPAFEIRHHTPDGARVESGTTLMAVTGHGRSLLLAERTALNFLGRLSGIATLTSRFVDAISGTGAAMLDTRKTAPAFRVLDKYAVRMGGGRNHRFGLYDMALIKDNHVDGAGGVAPAVERVRERFGDRLPVEVEVRDLRELETALSLPVDRILLDNMSLEDMRVAVALADGRIKLEASGNVTIDTVRAIAETGVDFISSGALTHSVCVFDVSMQLEKLEGTG